MTALERDAAALAVTVSAARQTVAAGGTVELAPGTRRLEDLLDQLACLSDAERKRHLPRLHSLFDDMEALAHALESEAQHCRDGIARSGASTRAAVAYARRAGN